MIEILYILVFFAFYIWYTVNKYVGLYLSVFTLFFSNFLIYVNNYGTLFMIKATLICFTSLCLFSGIIYKCIEGAVNKILT